MFSSSSRIYYVLCGLLGETSTNAFPVCIRCMLAKDAIIFYSCVCERCGCSIIYKMLLTKKTLKVFTLMTFFRFSEIGFREEVNFFIFCQITSVRARIVFRSTRRPSAVMVYRESRTIL